MICCPAGTSQELYVLETSRDVPTTKHSRDDDSLAIVTNPLNLLCAKTSYGNKVIGIHHRWRDWISIYWYSVIREAHGEKWRWCYGSLCVEQAKIPMWSIDSIGPLCGLMEINNHARTNVPITPNMDTMYPESRAIFLLTFDDLHKDIYDPFY